MAISQEQRTDLLTLIVGIFDGAPSSAQLSELSQMIVDGSSMEDVANLLVSSEQFEETYPAYQTAEDFATVLADNILGDTVSAQTKTDAVNLVAGFVNEGQTFGEAAYNAITLLQDVDLTVNPEWTEAQAILANKAAVAEYFALNTEYSDELTTAQSQAVVDGVSADEATVTEKTDAIDAGTIFGGEPTTGLDLTEDRDILNGTSGDDTFVAAVSANDDGAVANALSTGDSLDGLAGRDMLEATLINDQIEQGNAQLAVRPVTDNIEEVYIEALDDVTLNATRMSNVEEYWSNFSDADLTIQNVSLRGNNLQITKDLTFGLRDTNASTDFTAYIESPALTAAPDTVSNSQLSVQIADVSTETPETPLLNVNMDLGFTIGGESYVLEDLQADGGTYAGLITAVQTALAELGLGDLVVSAGDNYNQVTFAGNTVTLPFTATELLVSDPNGGVFSDVTFQQNAIEPVEDGFLVAGTAAPVAPTASSNLIETNVVLDYAGRGSIGGDVTIGGQSTSEEGVQQFNVTVDRDSSISSLVQTASSFIAGGDNNEQLMNIFIDSAEANGDLYIGGIDENLELVNATAFLGDELSIGEMDDVNNLRTFNAAGVDADVTFVADYDGDGLESDEQSFTITTGSGDDNITAELDGTSTSTSTTTSVTINAGAGDNTITLSAEDDDVVEDTAESNQAYVTTLGGDDVVTGGGVDLVVDTNAGDDVVYAENTGDKTVATAAKDAYATSTTVTLNGDHATTVNQSALLYGRQVRVTLDFDAVGADAELSDNFTQGFESALVDIEDNGYLTTERDLYNAIAKAINEDSVLSTLASAEVQSNGNLVVTYKVDGVSTAGTTVALEYDIVGDYDDLSTSQQSNLLAAIQDEYNDSNISAAELETEYDNVDLTAQDVLVSTAGTDSTTTGSNTVNVGTGNDVVVFSSNDAVAETLVLDTDNIGVNTVVHFNSAANGDRLDFTAWLDNVESTSGSTSSQEDVEVTFAAATAMTENSVSVTDFSVLDAETATNLNFDSMTDSQVLAALNASGGAYDSAAADTDLVGNVQKSILMVQNDANEGEYKVYQVTSSADATATDEFSGATLIGTLDFGSELDATFDATNLIGA